MTDELDKRLILDLQNDGRATYVDIARKYGIAEGTIRKRIKRLLSDEIIKVSAVPNVRKLGFGLISIVGFQVKMEDLRNVADNLACNKHICYLAFVAGRYDLMAIVVTSSPEELSSFLEKEISAIPSILRNETFVNLDVIKGKWPMIETSQLIAESISSKD